MPKQKSKTAVAIPDERIIGKIYFIRGEKVMFDRDLAVLYGVETKALNRAVKRNIKRFPDDFMFQLNRQEVDIFSRCQIGTLNDENLKCQIGTSSWGGARTSPYVFTEQGIAMLSSVLKSDRAIQVNIQIMRTFTNMRKMLLTNKELREKIEKMEENYDKKFKAVFDVIVRFMKSDPKDNETKVLGFREK